jgi:hypothetical protein
MQDACQTDAPLDVPQLPNEGKIPNKRGKGWIPTSHPSWDTDGTLTGKTRQ